MKQSNYFILMNPENSLSSVYQEANCRELSQNQQSTGMCSTGYLQLCSTRNAGKIAPRTRRFKTFASQITQRSFGPNKIVVQHYKSSKQQYRYRDFSDTSYFNFFFLLDSDKVFNFMASYEKEIEFLLKKEKFKCKYKKIVFQNI